MTDVIHNHQEFTCRLRRLLYCTIHEYIILGLFSTYMLIFEY